MAHPTLLRLSEFTPIAENAPIWNGPVSLSGGATKVTVTTSATFVLY
jgi:hypothetical protein